MCVQAVDSRIYTRCLFRHEPRPAREERFLKRIAETVKKGGRVLLPIVALGRAQVRRLSARVSGFCID